MQKKNNKSIASSDLSGERMLYGGYRLKVVSSQVDMFGFSLFGDDDANGEAAFFESDDGYAVSFDRSSPHGAEITENEMICEAEVTIDAGRFTLAYNDGTIDADSDYPTEISFETDNPGTVTLTRGGELSSVMIFEANKRHRSEYKTPFMAFDMCIYSRAVENSLNVSGGRLVLDYAVEIRGAAAQRTRIEMTLDLI